MASLVMLQNNKNVTDSRKRLDDDDSDLLEESNERKAKSHDGSINEELKEEYSESDDE